MIKSLVISGGPVPTALKTLIKFGKTARFCGKVGPDREGSQVLREFEEFGIDIHPVIIDPEVTTPRAYIWIDPRSGARTVALDRTGFSMPEVEQVDFKWINNCRVFLTDGRAGAASLKWLQIAREMGIITVLDLGAYRPRLEEMLPYVDFALVSQDLADRPVSALKIQSEIAVMDSDINRSQVLAYRLVENGVKNAVVTAGDKGAFCLGENTSAWIPSFSVVVFDTTGAGDVFHGAFIYGLLMNWDLERTTTFANAAAALSCRELSGTKGIPSLDEVMELVESRS